jgi:hypothetical protein
LYKPNLSPGVACANHRAATPLAECIHHINRENRTFSLTSKNADHCAKTPLGLRPDHLKTLRNPSPTGQTAT